MRVMVIVKASRESEAARCRVSSSWRTWESSMRNL
jgi:hypothetical protein